MHGITDSLYIQKKGINERDIRELCREIELEIGVPISYEGIFRWIVFLPSVNDNARPVATHYYGLFEHGEIKVRGIETRQRGVSKIIKYYQNQVFDIMAKFRTKEEITNSFPVFCSLLRELVNVLHYLKPEALSSFVVVSKTDYKNNIPQKIVLEQLKKKSIKIVAGQKVSYIFSTKGAVLPEDYKHNPDIMRYRRLLVRSLFVIMQPFGFTKDDIYRMIKDERQTTLIEHCKTPLHTDAKDIQIPQASV
jgi:DNA polymerase-2